MGIDSEVACNSRLYTSMYEQQHSKRARQTVDVFLPSGHANYTCCKHTLTAVNKCWFVLSLIGL